MKKLLRKTLEVVPDRPQSKASTSGTSQQPPLYARFTSSASASAISGPAPLSVRVDPHTRLPGNGRKEARQNYSPQAPTSKGRGVDKPLPSADFREGKPLPDPDPSTTSDRLPHRRSDVPLVVEFKNVNLLDEDATEPDEAHSGDPEISSMPSRSSVELQKPDGTLQNGVNSSSAPPSSGSIPRSNPSVSQKREIAQDIGRPKINEFRGLVTPPDSPSRNGTRRTFSPMAAFGLVPPQLGSESSYLQSSTMTLPLPQPDTVNSHAPLNNIASPASRPTPSPQRTVPLRKPSPDNPSEQHAAPQEFSVPVEFQSDHTGGTDDPNTSKPPRESLPSSFNSSSEPRVRADSLGRSRTPTPLGPRASLNNGPSSLVQGQPRIFAPMAMSSVPDPQDPPLKPSRPRIFAVTNPDVSPTRAPPPQEHPRYPSPPLTNPSSSPYSRYETTPRSFQSDSTRDRNSLSATPVDGAPTHHRRGTSNHYHSSRSPPRNSGNQTQQRSQEEIRFGDDTQSSPPRDIKGKGPAVLRRPPPTEPQHPPAIEILSDHQQSTLSYPKGTRPDVVHHPPRTAIDDSNTTKGKDTDPAVLRRPFMPPPHQSIPTIPPETQRDKATPPPDKDLDVVRPRPKNLEVPVGVTARLPNPQITASRHGKLPHSNSHGGMGKSGGLLPSSNDGRLLEGRNTHKDGNVKMQGGESEISADQPNHYSLERHLLDPCLLGNLLRYLTFYEWLVLYGVNKSVRTKLTHTNELKEEVLESYLRNIGYSRWIWEDAEPLALSLRDLSEYMRGVSAPTHQHTQISEAYLQSRSSTFSREEKAVFTDQARAMSFGARAYSRVVIRLRFQAEAVARHAKPTTTAPNGAAVSRSRPTTQGTTSRTSSRAPSPASSLSHPQPYASRSPSVGYGHGTNNDISSRTTFTSPIYRPRRAPLLRVFVPSPDGDWLSDASVVECEAELERAGIAHLLRAGDAVWDIAVGDEGNAGRMIWDGAYLLDLDYSYSRTGDLPRYLPSLAFSPSYFHRVIKIVGNPVVYIDLAPWADQIKMNTQLLQDRVKTETAQGNYHTVVRWVHHTSFEIHPPPAGKRIHFPFGSGNWTIDRGWYGTVFVEAEGTNEGLADLQDRCNGVLALRDSDQGQSSRAEERRRIFRILRERSKPGEIWIRTVSEKERLLP